MKRLSTRSWRSWLSGCVIATTAMTSGCFEGSDGADGKAGTSAAPLVTTVVPSAITTSIDSATVAADGTLAVTFSITDDQGYGYTGLAAKDIRFTVARLTPANINGDGEPGKWQSYINEKEEIQPDLTKPIIGPGLVDTIQASYEKGDASGTFVNNDDGSYSYTLEANLKSVTAPVAVSYDPALTHRVAFQLGGGLPANNAIYDWQPSTGLSGDNVSSRKIVTEGTCNSCHGELALHGSRVDTDYCVTCHNPGSSDANSGNTVDFKVMVHKIHRGKNLQQVIDGDEYTIWGYKDIAHDYSTVSFPQNIRNCLTCHNESDETTPQASNWKTQPSIEACGSCHDGIDFDAPVGDPGAHPLGPQPDSKDCLDCHGAGEVYSVENVHQQALINLETARDDLVIDIVTAELKAAGTSLEVTVEMTLNDTAVTDYITQVKPLVLTGGGDLLLNWDNGEGYQFAYRTTPGNTVAFNDISACVPTAGQFVCTWDVSAKPITGDGVIAVSVTGLVLCANERSLVGELIDCSTAESVTPFVKVGTIALTPPKKTYQLVGIDTELAEANTTKKYEAGFYEEKLGADRDSCNNCHKDLTGHAAGSRAKGAMAFSQCKSCHNAQRPAFYTGRFADLKSNVHWKHNNLGFYPGDIENCNACHSKGQIDLPLQQNTRPTQAGNAATGSGVVFVSPTVAVCSACHLSVPLGFILPSGTASGATLSSSDGPLLTHMITNGAVFGETTLSALVSAPESCSVCHSSGSVSAVDTVHNLQ